MLWTALSADDTTSALFAALRDAHGADAELEEWTAQPLTKRGKGRAVRYDVRARVAGGAHVRCYQWVGKYYDDDAEARRVMAVLRSLAASDCDARGGVVIPTVVSYYAPHRLLLVRYESGVSVIRAIGEHGDLAVRAIGRALAALHVTPVPFDGMMAPAVVLARLRPKVAELQARLPGETGPLHRVLLALERQAPSGLPGGAFLHGDCGPAQLLWQDGHIVALDFDSCTHGDPALDLGNFLAQLRRIAFRHPGKLPDFAALRAGILDAYRRWSVRDSGLNQRVAWYERATLLRKIHSLVCDATRHAQSDVEQRRAEAMCLLEWVR